ncbi:MAG: TldD/PmbA family protein, partial [Alphaproteobacteria bacterium]|nr:TldD/PmbA family protein [Alphaproteobacteria bacterium]
MTDTLLDLASHAIAHARRIGASSADAVVVDGRGTDIDVREGRIEKLEQAEGREIGIRVFSGQSSAGISGSVLTKVAIADLVEKALAMARLAPPDPFAGIATPDQLATSFPELDLVSERLPDSAELEAMARAAEEAALAISGVSKSGGAGASASDNAMAIAISNGFARTMRRTGISLAVSAITGEGTAMERDYDFTSAVHFSDLRRPEDVGREAGLRAARRRNPQKLKSQAVPVFFDRRVATSLIGHVLGAINGAAIARGTSFLK